MVGHALVQRFYSTASALLNREHAVAKQKQWERNKQRRGSQDQQQQQEQQQQPVVEPAVLNLLEHLVFVNIYYTYFIN